MTTPLGTFYGEATSNSGRLMDSNDDDDEQCNLKKTDVLQKLASDPEPKEPDRKIDVPKYFIAHHNTQKI